MNFQLINYVDYDTNKEGKCIPKTECVLIDRVEIPEGSTTKDIAKILKEVGYLETSDMRRLSIKIRIGNIIEINSAKGNIPLGRLEPVYNK